MSQAIYPRRPALSNPARGSRRRGWRGKVLKDFCVRNTRAAAARKKRPPRRALAHDALADTMGYDASAYRTRVEVSTWDDDDSFWLLHTNRAIVGLRIFEYQVHSIISALIGNRKPQFF